MDDILEVLEVTIVAICLHEAGIRPPIDIAKCRYLKFSKFRFVNRCAEASAFQIPTESHINPGCTQRIEREFRIERVFWVFRHTYVEVCKVGEQHPATGRIGGTRMAVGALRLAIEQRESKCLLGSQPVARPKICVEPRVKRTYLFRSLVFGNRATDHLVRLLDVFESVKAPHVHEQVRILRLLHLIHDHSGARIVLLQRVQEWAYSLLGQRISERQSSGATVPEHAACPTVCSIEMQIGAIAAIRYRRWFSIAKPTLDGTLIHCAIQIDSRVGSGPSDLRRMTTGAGQTCRF